MKLYVWNHTNLWRFGNFYGTSQICVTANSVAEALEYIKNSNDNFVKDGYQYIMGYWDARVKHSWDKPESKWHPLWLEMREKCIDNGKFNKEKMNIHDELKNKYESEFQKYFDSYTIDNSPYFCKPIVCESVGAIFASQASD